MPPVLSAPVMIAALVPGVVVLLLVLAAIVLARRRLRGAPGTARGNAAALGREPVVGGMSMRELAFVAEATRARRTATGVPVVVPGLPVAPPAPKPEEPAYAGKVHCPACGSALAEAGPLLKYVTRCRACDRHLAARIEGARLIVEVRDG